jgi:hypothetical protein
MEFRVRKNLKIIGKPNPGFLLAETVPLVKTGADGFENGQKREEEVHRQRWENVPPALPARLSGISILYPCHLSEKRPAREAPVFW